MPKEQFIRTLRSLAECYQAFEAYSGTHVRKLGLTSAQFDIVATLGNTPGMTCKELGEKTLITKGTLDRRAGPHGNPRACIRRTASDADRRQVFIVLTPSGGANVRARVPGTHRPPQACVLRVVAARTGPGDGTAAQACATLCAKRMRNARQPDMNPSLQRYTGVAITLHWLIAAIILGTFFLGQYMTGLQLSPAKLKLYSYHKWIGVTIFLLVLVRIAWRISHRPPAPPASMPAWQHSAANIAHFFLYAADAGHPFVGLADEFGFRASRSFTSVCFRSRTCSPRTRTWPSN